MFELPPCLALRESLGDEADIVAFAERLLDREACSDFDALQALVEQAYGLAQSDEPPENPFERAPEPGKGPTIEPAVVAEQSVPVPESMPDLSAAALPESRSGPATRWGPATCTFRRERAPLSATPDTFAISRTTS